MQVGCAKKFQSFPFDVVIFPDLITPALYSQAHIYDIIQNEDNEEVPQQRESKGEAATNTDSFYDLLQAVNYH